LIRSYLESVTGIITGSDHLLDLKLNRDLFELGMAGEGVVDDTVWLVKSHYPERLGHSPVAVNRCVLVVRSPLDSFWSFFNMMATQSHNQSIPEGKVLALQEIWDLFIRDEVKTWRDFHEYWVKPPQKVPLHVVRYEDLLSHPEETLVELLKFLYSRLDDLSETLLVKRIKEATVKKPEVYKPRSGQAHAN